MKLEHLISVFVSFFTPLLVGVGLIWLILSVGRDVAPWLGGAVILAGFGWFAWVLVRHGARFAEMPPPKPRKDADGR